MASPCPIANDCTQRCFPASQKAVPLRKVLTSQNMPLPLTNATLRTVLADTFPEFPDTPREDTPQRHLREARPRLRNYTSPRHTETNQ